MNLMKDILKRGVIGIFIGVFIVQTIGLISIVASGSTEPITTDFFIKQYIAGVVIGFTNGSLNVLFQWERLGIASATVIHFIISSIIFYPMAYFAGWISNDAMSIGGITAIMVVLYFIFWFICYIGWKRYIREINSRIKR